MLEKALSLDHCQEHAVLPVTIDQEILGKKLPNILADLKCHK